MRRHHVWSLPLLAVYLLCSIATAHAECTWVLWAGVERNPRPLVGDPIEWTPMESFGTKRECLKTASLTTKNPTNKDWEFRCLSDAIDPRGPKAK
jgi:hypothetical protein